MRSLFAGAIFLLLLCLVIYGATQEEKNVPEIRARTNDVYRATSTRRMLNDVMLSKVSGERKRGMHMLATFDFPNRHRYDIVHLPTNPTPLHFLMARCMLRHTGLVKIADENPEYRAPFDWLRPEGEGEWSLLVTEDRCGARVISDYLVNEVCQYRGKHKLYSVSHERESELLDEYRDEVLYTYVNVTSLVNAIVLHLAYPKIALRKGEFRPGIKEVEAGKMWYTLQEWWNQNK